MNKHYLFILTRKRYLITVATVVLVAIIGTLLIINSHAATPYESTTASSGQLTAGAVTQSCSGATNGSCVLFQGTSGGTTGSTQANCVTLDSSGTPTISCGYPGSSTDTTPVGAGSVCSQPVYDIIQNRPSGTYWDASRGNSLEITGAVSITDKNLGDVSFDVAASVTNFTLNNDCISNNGDGDGDPFGSIIVNINAGASGVVIENSTLTGSNDTTGVVNKVVQDFGTGTQILNNYMDNLAGGVFEKGPGNALVKNNYIFLNGTMLQTSGSQAGQEVHYEPVYCTDNNTLTIDHNTLFNTHGQTAAIFCDDNGGTPGPCSNIVNITNNFLAGGGAVIYPCGGSSTGPGTSDITVDNNRIARSLGASADSHGYWPYGGYYDLVWPNGKYAPPYLNWSGNYWDDNLQTVNPTDTGI